MELAGEPVDRLPVEKILKLVNRLTGKLVNQKHAKGTQGKFRRSVILRNKQGDTGARSF